MDNKELLKKAIFGLIADNVKKIDLNTLYSRIKDQADKYGVYYPAWSIFIDTLRENNIYIDESTNTAYLN
jgi:hypothetical protein